MANTVQVHLSQETYIQVGEALKQQSLKKIQEAVRNNLQMLVENGYLQDLISQIQSLNILEIDQQRQRYHAANGKQQFAGLNQKITHYQIKKEANDIAKKLFTFQNLINNLRSAILGLPNIDYSLGIKNGNQYYYITKDMGVDTEAILLNSSISDNGSKFNRQNLRTHGESTKKEIEKAIDILKDDEYFQHLSAHFTNMMIKIPQISNPPSSPKISWASQVFEKHIQETGEKNKDIINTLNWEHSWQPVRNFWDDYHATRPGYDKSGHYLGYASATQGGDVFQTQVKSFSRYRSYWNFSNVNVVNMNNMSDIFSFWMDTIHRIEKNKKISNKIINDILSVLLPNEKIIELGYRTIGNIRDLDF